MDDGSGDVSAAPPVPAWSFLTHHAQVLVCLQDDPTTRIKDVASRTGLTERTIKSIIEDLVAAGFVRRTRIGRRNTYAVDGDRALSTGIGSERRTAAFLDAVAALADLDYQDALDTVARHVVDLVGDTALIAMLTPDGEFLEPLAFQHQDPDRHQQMLVTLSVGSIPVGTEVAGRVVQTGQPALLADPRGGDGRSDLHPLAREFVDRFGIRSMMVIPLQDDGLTIGVVAAARTRGRPYTEADLAAVEQLASRAAPAIAEARRSRANLAVEAYDTLFRISLEGVLVSTPDGRILAANPAACAMLRGTEAEITRCRRADLIDDDDPDTVDAVARRARGEVVTVEVPFRRLDGTTFVAHLCSAEFETTAGEKRACVILRERHDAG